MGNDQIRRVVEMKDCIRGDHRGGAVFRDYGWAGIFLAGVEGLAGVDSGFQFLTIEEDFGLWDSCRASPGWDSPRGCPYVGRFVFEGCTEAESY